MPYRNVHPSSVAGCWTCWQLAGRWLLCRRIWGCHTRPYITGAVRRPSTVVSTPIRGLLSGGGWPSPWQPILALDALEQALWARLHRESGAIRTNQESPENRGTSEAGGLPRPGRRVRTAISTVSFPAGGCFFGTRASLVVSLSYIAMQMFRVST